MAAQLVTILSPNFTVATRGREPDLIVVHSTEGLGAENVARYLAQRKTNASAHDVIDDDTVVIGVWDEFIAWAAPGANQNGIQLELCGFARWSRAEWLKRLPTLYNAAERAAQRIRKYPRIRPVWLDADALKRGERGGLTWHHAVTDALHLSTHTDPNNGHGLTDGFPFDVFLDLVHQHLGGVPAEEEEMLTEKQETALFNVDSNSKETLNLLRDIHTMTGQMRDALVRLANASAPR